MRWNIDLRFALKFDANKRHIHEGAEPQRLTLHLFTKAAFYLLKATKRLIGYSLFGI